MVWGNHTVAFGSVFCTTVKGLASYLPWQPSDITNQLVSTLQKSPQPQLSN